MAVIYATDGTEILVDAEDVSLLTEMKWTRHCKNGYFSSNCFGTAISMHRLLMGFPIRLDVDHIDGNKNNNRKSNLRVCTHQQNQSNMKKARDAGSKYHGVTWNARQGKWQAQMMWKHKYMYIGIYDDELEAARAYNELATQVKGKFARLNDI